MGRCDGIGFWQLITEDGYPMRDDCGNVLGHEVECLLESGHSGRCEFDEEAARAFYS